MSVTPRSPAQAASRAGGTGRDGTVALVVLGLLVAGNAYLWFQWCQREGLFEPHPDPRKTCHDRPIVRRDGRTLLWAGEDRNGSVRWFDVTDAAIDPTELQFGIGADRIASIERPQFAHWPDERLRKAQMDRDTLVIGVELNGDARAYPLLTLGSHELVNDVVGGRPVTVGY